MKKSYGLKKINIAVFISGTGSNLKNLIKFSQKKGSKFRVNLIISNKSHARGLEYAKKYDIKKKVVNYSNPKNAEKKIIYTLNKSKINLICLAGFMKKLSGNFIKSFNGTIINIHPSLLPKYKGLNTHKRAIKNKDKYSGCTVHYVNSKIDDGKIIIQKKVRIKKDDTEYSLSKRILKNYF